MPQPLIGAFCACVVALFSTQTLAQYGVNVLYDAPDFNLLDGVVDADPNVPGAQSTLRACIQNMNLQPAAGSYTILVPPGHYLLSHLGSGEDSSITGDLDIRRDVAILGSAPGAVTIDGFVLGDRLFDVRGPHTIFLSNLELIYGTAPATENGGGIRQPGGSLTLSSVDMRNCSAPGSTADGGAIHITGDLDTQFPCSFETNSSGDHGGAVYATGNVIFTDTVFSGNQAGGRGGALRVTSASPALDVNNCFFDGNRSNGSGGAINTATSTEIRDSFFLGNDAVAVGGALGISGGLFMERTVFEGNHSSSGGGAMNVTGAIGALVEECHFLYNVADTSGGAATIAAASEFRRCTFEYNDALGDVAFELGGGAIYNFQQLIMVNCTLSHNTAFNGYGGGLLNLTGGFAELANVTMHANIASLGDSICNGTPSGGSTLRLDHSIISHLGGGVGPNVYGTSLPLLSLGNNFDSDGTSGIVDPTDLVGTPVLPIDPLLAPLIPTGGFAPTHELLPGSPCWDSGDLISIDPTGVAITQDQRQFVRPVGRVDRGAVEMPTVACRADHNGDGVLDTSDVLAFLNDWTAGSLAADFNNDGILNTADVLAFLNAWIAGCP